MTLPGYFPIAPLALAATTGFALRALEVGAPRLARVLGGTSLAAQLALSLLALGATAGGGPLAYRWSPWPLRAGLTLLLDPLAAWMLLSTALVALLALVAGAQRNGDAAGRGASWLQFQLLALMAVFLVSDLLSLYLCGAGAWWLAWQAVVRGGGEPRGRVAMLAGALALALAIGGVVASVGTLDFAQLALAAPAMPAAEATLPSACAFVMLAVFALGAIAAPLALWPAHAGVPIPAAALVLGGGLASGCVYAIVRLFTLVFPCFIAGPCGPSGLALPLGLSLVTWGALATLVAVRARTIIAWLMVLSLGLAMVAVGSFRAAGLGAGVYLLVHATLGGAALLVTRELMARRMAAGAPGLAPALYYAALAAMICLPPLPGFLGSVALLRASGPDALAVWTLVLSAMLLGLIGAVRHARLGAAADEPGPAPAAVGGVAAATTAVAALVALAVAAGPALDYSLRAARQLLDRSAYVTAVDAARRRGADGASP